MDEAKLTQLASLLGVEPTVEALKSALEQVMMVLDGGENGAEPTEEQAQYQEAMRSAFGVDSNEAVLSTLKNIKSLLDATAGEGEGESGGERELAVNLAGLAEFGAEVNEAAKSAKNVPLRIPYNSQSGKKSRGAPAGGAAANFPNYNKTEAPSLKSFINAYLHNDKKQLANATKAQGTTQNVLGGYLLRDEVANEIIAPLYDTPSISRAGIRVETMDTETMTFRKNLGGSAVYWGGEHESVDQSELTWGKVDLVLKEMVAENRQSLKLLRFGRNVEQTIRDDIIEAVNLEVDRAGLFGTGAQPSGSGHSGSEPLGLYHTLTNNSDDAALYSTSLGTNGAKPKYIDFVKAQSDIVTRKIRKSPSWASIMSERDWMYLSSITDTTGNPLLRQTWKDGEDDMLAGLRVLPSTQVPVSETVGSTSDNSYIFVGDWQYAIMGIGGEVEIRISEETYFRERGILVQAVMYMDFGVFHKEAFQVLTGVRGIIA